MRFDISTLSHCGEACAASPPRRQGRARDVRHLLPLFFVLLLKVAPAAAAAPTRLLVLEGLDLPDDMANVHGRIRKDLETIAGAEGREVVAGSETRWCSTADCFRMTAQSAGAGEVLSIRGGRNEYEGYQLAIELRRADGNLVATEAGSCNVCSGPEMVTLAQSLGRRLLAAAPPVEPPTILTPAPMLVTPAPIPPPRNGPNSVVAGLAIASAGLVAVVAGGYLWHLDGSTVDCESNGVGGQTCPSVYRTERFGIPLTVVGAAGLVVGTVFVVRAASVGHTRLVGGPGSVALLGSF
jgi:hypothetical protein